jgi:cytidyltransferase-like protein
MNRKKVFVSGCFDMLHSGHLTFLENANQFGDVYVCIGSAGLVMAIVGGAVMPKLQGMIIDYGGHNVDDIKILGVSEINFSFVLPLLCFILISIYGFKQKRN